MVQILLICEKFVVLDVVMSYFNMLPLLSFYLFKQNFYIIHKSFLFTLVFDE
jgi:hypothetical protein